jgi:hypothetical protein
MPGLLTDVNVQGHLPFLHRLIVKLRLEDLLVSLGLALTTFPDLGLDRHTDDRAIWNYCQANGWVLLTDNRNNEDEDSLQATLQDSWREGHLPVMTFANKGKFEASDAYALAVAEDVVDILVGVFSESVRDQPRIFVPRRTVLTP